MEKIVDMMIKAYIEVMGADKWNSLTAEEQHDVIMLMVKDSLNALR
jgi:autonomous glycyl radical cofactor GrcA